jgi:hypothetical protein
MAALHAAGPHINGGAPAGDPQRGASSLRDRRLLDQASYLAGRPSRRTPRPLSAGSLNFSMLA